MITFLQETTGDGAKSMIVESIKFEAFFLQTKICPTLQKLNGQISNIVLNYFFPREVRERSLHLKGWGVCFFLKHILIPNIAEKNILILVEEKNNNRIQSFCHIT